jgi:hypothetical protein
VQLVRKLGEEVAGPRVGGAAPATPRRLPVPMDLPIPFDANGLETVSMALQNRMMTLVAFLQAQNCSNLPGSWRHPATMLDFLTPEYYSSRVIERTASSQCIALPPVALSSDDEPCNISAIRLLSSATLNGFARRGIAEIPPVRRASAYPVISNALSSG